MYFIKNPLRLLVASELDPKASRIEFRKSSVIALCVPGRESDGPLKFKIRRATRLTDCKPLHEKYWSAQDEGELGGARIVRITFDADQFTEDYIKRRSERHCARQSDDHDAPNRALYEALLGAGKIALLVEIEGRDDPERVDSLILALDYGRERRRQLRDQMRSDAAE